MAGAKVVLKSGRALGENIPAWFGLSKQTNGIAGKAVRVVIFTVFRGEKNAPFRKNREAEMMSRQHNSSGCCLVFRLEQQGGSGFETHSGISFPPFPHLLPVPVHVRTGVHSTDCILGTSKTTTSFFHDFFHDIPGRLFRN